MRLKVLEIGIGFEAARQPGSKVHDEIIWDEEKGDTREKQIMRVV